MAIKGYQCSNCGGVTYRGGGYFADSDKPPSACHHCGGHELFPEKCPRCDKSMYLPHYCEYKEPPSSTLKTIFVVVFGNFVSLMVWWMVIVFILYKIG